MIDVETGEIEDTAKLTVKGEVDQLIPLIENAGKALCLEYAKRKISGLP